MESCSGSPTKPEVMAVVFSKLSLKRGGVFGDVGCGSGAVTVEALSRGAGRVFAIDARREAVEVARRNIEGLGLGGRVRFLLGEAPGVLGEVPVLDAAFVGGSRNIEGVLEVLQGRVRGRIVVNAVRVETVAVVLGKMRELGMFREAVQVGVCRAVELGGQTIFKPENPVYIIVGEGKC